MRWQREARYLTDDDRAEVRGRINVIVAGMQSGVRLEMPQLTPPHVELRAWAVSSTLTSLGRHGLSLPGTELSLPYNEIDDRAADLPADKATPLAIYCMSGNMSATAGRDLLDLGYADVVELDGGMRAWQSSGRTLLPAGS